MLEITLSQIKALPFDFETEVKKHIAALEAHRHSPGMDITKGGRVVEGEPAPAAVHGIVEAAIARKQYPIEAGKPDDFVPSYKIIDDTPSLDERKAALAQELDKKVMEASHAIIPPLKRRLHDMNYSDAQKVSRADRTDVHHATIAEYEAKHVKIAELHRYLAQAHSDIHELTEETIKTWEPAPLPT